MATIGTSALTLADWGKRVDQDGKVAKIIELLNLRNEIIDDMLWTEGNLPTGHQTTIRTGLPAATWRLLNYGVQQSKSRTVQVTDSCGLLEAYATIDKTLADLNGNTAAFRMSEDAAFLEAMNQAFATTLFYGNTATNPEQFMGLASRYNTVTVANAENADNVLDGGGTGSTNCSIWLVVWDPLTITGIFPKGSQAGFSMQDLGEQTVYDSNNNPYQAYRSHYVWKCGVSVRDWRYAVRIANVDVTTLTKNASAGTDLIDFMAQALERVKDTTSGRPCFYVGRKVRSFLRRQIVNKVSQSTLSMDSVGGKKVLFFDEVPVKRVDALLETEARVV